MRCKIPVVLVAVLAVVASDLSAQRGGRRRGRNRSREPVVLQNFDYKEVEFETDNIEGGTGRYGLYLPKGWSAPAKTEEGQDPAPAKEGKLPLIVWLHGFGGFYEFQGRGAAKTIDALRGENEIPEVAIATFVAPGGRRSRSVYVNGEASGQIEDAIAMDLVDHLVENYPIDASRDRHGIMGISLGGFGALKIAMKHTDRFAAVGAHSAAIFPDDPEAMPEAYKRRIGFMMSRGLDAVFGDPIDKAKWAAEMPMGLARNAKEGAFSKLEIYFDAGSEDRYGFGPPNQELSEVMTDAGIDHTFRHIEGGGHAWSSDGMLDNVKMSVKFVADAITAPTDADAKKAEGAEKGAEKGAASQPSSMPSKDKDADEK